MAPVIRLNRVCGAWKSHLEVFLVSKRFEFRDDAWVIWISEAGRADQGLLGLILDTFPRSIPMRTKLKRGIEEWGGFPQIQTILDPYSAVPSIRGVKSRKMASFATDRAIR